MLEASNLEEIEIQEGEESVRLVKNKTDSAPIAQQVSLPNTLPVSDGNTQTHGSTEEKPSEEVVNGESINSPMVGTFYSSTSPGSKPFISVGDHVNEGDVVCIVEAMKLFNEIEAEVSGKIVKVLFDDESPVEYDQALFLVDPS